MAGYNRDVLRAVERQSGRTWRARGLALIVLAAAACGPQPVTLEVTATAYNSLPGQTQGDPRVTAWGHRLEPGMRAIAVSRDLLELGLGHGTRVRIEGLEGEYRVLDKMARRWRKKIDVYMGLDEKAAREWGVRRVRIFWESE